MVAASHAGMGDYPDGMLVTPSMAPNSNSYGDIVVKTRADNLSKSAQSSADQREPCRLRYRDHHGLTFFILALLVLTLPIIGLIIQDIYRDFELSVVKIAAPVGLLFLPLYQTVEFMPSSRQVQYRIRWLFWQSTRTKGFDEISEIIESEAVRPSPQSSLSVRFTNGSEWYFNFRNFHSASGEAEQIRELVGLVKKSGTGTPS